MRRYLTFVSGGEASGIYSMIDPGNYAQLQVEWISDESIAAELARRNRLATAKNLYVKPDLSNPAIQRCVGRAVALGVGEQFPGQLWAACADTASPVNQLR